jgi:hypothetical protein
MMQNSTTVSADVTLGQKCDSRASRVPTPTPLHLRTVQPAEGGALRESPRGAGPPQSPRLRSAEPVAALRPDAEHRASRRGMSTPVEIEPTQGFRLLCALIRRELGAHPALNWREGYTDLVEHMKTAAAKAQLPYGQDKLTRALHAVEASVKARAPKRQPEPPRVHWRDRCAHTPRCTTPTQCELRATREGR